MNNFPSSNFILQGRYKIISQIGSGGMSSVYLAEDLKLGCRWAVKEIIENFHPDERATAIAQFEREAKILAELKHPNIPKVIDFFEENGRYYLIMEYVEGESLDEIAQKSIPAKENVINWTLTLCDVLEKLHKSGIVYRDIKPANIVIDKAGELHLIDFGIARFFNKGKIKDTIIAGTPGFAAPEQHGLCQTDARTDIYGLGAMLHYLLTGCDPGLSPFIFKPPVEINSAIGRDLSNVILKAVSIEPEKRFSSAIELKNAIIKAASNKDEKKTGAGSLKSEKFIEDPVKKHAFAAVISGGAISTTVIMLTAGAVTVPVAALAVAAVVPGTFIAGRLIKYLSKIPENPVINLSSEGIEAIRGKVTIKAKWDEIDELLEFTEKSNLGINLKRYRIKAGDSGFEYDGRLCGVMRLNNMIITGAGLCLKNDTEGFRRYIKPAKETEYAR